MYNSVRTSMRSVGHLITVVAAGAVLGFPAAGRCDLITDGRCKSALNDFQRRHEPNQRYRPDELLEIIKRNCAAKDFDAAKKVADEEADAESVRKTGFTRSQLEALHAMWEAAMYNRPDAARQLIAAGFNVNWNISYSPMRATQRKYTAIKLAAEHSSVEVMEVLLSRNPDLTIRDDDGWAVLHTAARMGSKRAVLALLDAGADANIATAKEGDTPLHIAATFDNGGAAEALIEKGARADATASNGTTPLFAAADSCNAAIAGLLLKHGANAKAVAADGSTALHHAAGCANIQRDGSVVSTSPSAHPIVDLLLRSGARVNAKDKMGRTPLMIASQSRHPEIVAVLRRHGGR